MYAQKARNNSQYLSLKPQTLIHTTLLPSWTASNPLTRTRFITNRVGPIILLPSWTIVLSPRLFDNSGNYFHSSEPDATASSNSCVASSSAPSVSSSYVSKIKQRLLLSHPYIRWLAWWKQKHNPFLFCWYSIGRTKFGLLNVVVVLDPPVGPH